MSRALVRLARKCGKGDPRGHRWRYCVAAQLGFEYSFDVPRGVLGVWGLVGSPVKTNLWGGSHRTPNAAEWSRNGNAERCLVWLI